MLSRLGFFTVIRNHLTLVLTAMEDGGWGGGGVS